LFPEINFFKDDVITDENFNINFAWLCWSLTITVPKKIR
jgi:hypothetical protein